MRLVRRYSRIWFEMKSGRIFEMSTCGNRENKMKRITGNNSQRWLTSGRIRMQKCLKVVRVREDSFQSLSPVNIFLNQVEPRRIGGNLIYQLNERIKAFEDSLGIFVYSAGEDPDAKILLRAFRRRNPLAYSDESPVALLGCQCGDLKEQKWRVLASCFANSNTRHLRSLSSWMDIRARAERLLSAASFYRAKFDVGIQVYWVDSAPSGTHTTPWIIPREIIGRIS